MFKRNTQFRFELYPRRAEVAAAHPFVADSIPRDGYTLSGREFGAQHGGPALVLMHGFHDNQRLYDRLAPLLGERFRTITFDFVGWGDSSSPPEGYVYSVEKLRADPEAVVEYFELSSVVPVVHDASGWPGIDWALDNEARTAALVLLNTVYHAVAGTSGQSLRATGAPDALVPLIAEAVPAR